PVPLADPPPTWPYALSLHDALPIWPVSALVSRHLSRSLGKKISGRVKLSPAAMEATHDLDFVLWCLEPARPVRVYSQQNFGAFQDRKSTRLTPVTFRSRMPSSA